MKSKFKFSQRNWLRSSMIIVLLLCLIGQTACSAAKTPKLNNLTTKSTKGKSKAVSTKENELELLSRNGIKYVSAKSLVKLLGLQAIWNGKSGSYSVGDKDVNYILKLNSRDAQKEGEKIRLAAAPILINQSFSIPLSVVGDLFGREMSYTVSDHHLIVQENSKNSTIKIKSINDNYLDFGDDPDDPNKNLDMESSALSSDLTVMRNGEDTAVAVSTDIDIPRLIKKSKQYLGVKYIFGADPYPQSGGFDCSSFTQYIFAKQGIRLERLARDQAKQGTSVSRKNLRVGDLVFFSVPGRFKSNSVVGHVGIYLGNSKMIDADTQPVSGVQITNLDKDYWKGVFLSAKRVAH